MMRINRLLLVILGAASLAGCFGGAKVPPTLLTLTSTAPAPASVNRSAAPGEAITIDVPVVPKELATTRVPALVGPTAVAYIKGVMWVEAPDRLFRICCRKPWSARPSRRARPAPVVARPGVEADTAR